MLNESRNLPRLFESLRLHLPSDINPQLIVVDNGSTDDTVNVASALGADVYHSSGTVAGSRNIGAKHATADVLTFLDADVEITESWGKEIDQTIEDIVEDETIITGAWYRVRKDPGLLERFWFLPLERGPHSHINAGNLLLSTHAFELLHGFNESLVTGEDYEFTKRAIRRGYRLIENEELAVIHYGYPKSIREFLRREVWHGIGDYSSLSVFLGSKVALLSQLILFLIVGAIFAAFSGKGMTSILFATVTTCIVVGVSVWKYRVFGYSYVVINSAIYVFYFVARAVAVVPAITGRRWRSRHYTSNI